LILIFAVSILMAFAPTAAGQAGSAITSPRPTTAYIVVSPTLSGVGQTLTVNAWIEPSPQDYAMTSYYNPKLGGGSFQGVTATFTSPSGTTSTITPTDSIGAYPAGVTDALGTMTFYWSPDAAGNWSATVSMPAQSFTDVTGTVSYAACTSGAYYFTVQTAAVNAGLLNGYPYSPLPNSNVYWTYPINANNREWAAISGNWFAPTYFPGGSGINGGGYYQAYGVAPNNGQTGHMLWQTQPYEGGIAGGTYGSLSYLGELGSNTATVTEPILLGNVYIDLNTALDEFECISLTTGQLLYTATGFITGAVMLPGNAYAQSTGTTNPTGGTVVLAGAYGANLIPYLFGTGYVAGPTNHLGLPTTYWNYYNPVNGELVRQITNVTAGTFVFGNDNGLAWGQTFLNANLTTFEYTTNYVYEWNVSLVTGNDWPTGFVWRTNLYNPKVPAPGDGSDRTMVSMNPTETVLTIGGGAGDNMAEGFNAQTGASIWNLTTDYSAVTGFSGFGSGEIFMYNPVGNVINCYSDTTGTLVWSDTNVGNPTNGFSSYPYATKLTSAMCDGSYLYPLLPSGQIAKIDVTDGKILWYSAVMPSSELAANAVSFWSAGCIVGGVVYNYGGYYPGLYEQNPIPRFSVLVGINDTTGAYIFIQQGAVMVPESTADGYMTGFNTLTGAVYCIGKGQTSTSVSAPTTAQPLGTAILLQGNVLDQSPAQSGTPAVSDSSMSEQMDYLHGQNATLLNSGYTPTGVQVTLTALDPNNNTENIGAYTTDGKGNFAVLWTPPVPGKYTITASFAGTNSYWPSSSETFIGVSPAAAPTTTTTTVVSSGVSSTTLYAAIAAVIVVIIVIAIVLAVLMLRKRP